MRHQPMHRSSPLLALVIGVLLAAIPGSASVLAAGAQAPATHAPAPSLDQILRGLATYDGGIDSAAWWTLRDYVYARKDDQAGRAECEAKLLLFLKSKASAPGRLAAARLLRVIAADTAVPALQAMLTDERSSDLALYVLQPMPGAAADKAILEAISTARGATRHAVIAAAGERRMAAAVPVLAALLAQPDLAGPSALALGAIGGEAAVQALVAAGAGAPITLKPTLAAARLKCAERALASGDASAALREYESLAADASLPEAARAAAAIGRISASGRGGAAVILELLRGNDPAMHVAAIGRVREAVALDAVGPLCAALPGLPEASQVALLAALSGFPGEQVLPTVLQATTSEAPAVRLAALGVLPALGNATTVPMLLDLAARSRGPEQAAARAALAGLKGRAVDEALLAQLAKNPGEVLTLELLLAIGERRVYPARPAVAAFLRSDSAKVRAHALRSLRVIGTPSDIPAVLDLLVESDAETERAEAEGTVSALSQKVLRADQRGREVKARLAAEKDRDARARLMGLLPVVGDASALPVLRAALLEPDAEIRDAAVRAITAWPTGVARDDVFRLARDSRDETHRLLAIRSLIRLIGVERYREPEAAVADLQLAAGFAWRPEEQKLVLGALGQFPCRSALELARGFLANAEVKAEAQAAVARIEKGLK